MEQFERLTMGTGCCDDIGKVTGGRLTGGDVSLSSIAANLEARPCRS